MRDKPIVGWLTGKRAVSEYIGKSIQTLDRLRLKHGLPVTKLGGTIYALPALLDRWLIEIGTQKDKEKEKEKLINL